MEAYIPIIITALSSSGVTLVISYIFLGKRIIKRDSTKLDKEAFENTEYIRNKSVEVISKATTKIITLEGKVLELNRKNNITLGDLLELMHISEKHIKTCENLEEEYQQVLDKLKRDYDA